MKGKTCLVTGASRGIGFHTARALAAKGAHVILVGHHQGRGQAALARIQEADPDASVEFMLVDLSNQDHIRLLAEGVQKRFDHLDVLVNNAGGFFLRRRESADGIEMTFALDHLNYFLLTNLLLDLLKGSAPARIVNVSSAMHANAQMHFDDLQLERGYNGGKAYGQAKLAVLLFTYELARRLEGTGVTANVLHPGFVATHIGQQNWLVH
jgi:retinol dehydrogenase-12